MSQLIRYFLLAVFLALPGVNYANQSDNSALFVLLSKEASIRATPSGYELTLKGVNPTATYFSNRPARLSGQIYTSKLVDQWNTGEFRQSSPNAVIETVTFNQGIKHGSHKQNSYAVVIDKAMMISENEIRFEIKALPGNKTPLPNFAKTEYVAVFIDQVCLSCIIG